jgi:tripartite-type tricarboxylate transporter receptor subunit TctC
MFVPAKTPPELVARLHDETQKALDAPSVKDRYAKLGVEPMRMTQEEFAKYFRADVEDTARLVKAAKIPSQERN